MADDTSGNGDDSVSTLRFLGHVVRRWYLSLPALLVVIGVLVPLGYLVIRALQADPTTLAEIVFRWRNAVLLFNTLTLTLGVLVLTTVLALPMAWLTTRVHIRGQKLLTLLGVLPLAVPGYVMAYVLLGTTGQYGTLARSIGLVLPRLEGYDGALIALSLTTFPYLFLNLRTALLGLDPRVEESARTLGYSRFDVFYRVILPQLRPGFLAGGLLVGLHVLGDFGVVSLMRFETFTYALYLQYTAAYDRIYAAWLALILLVLTLVALALEAYLLKGLLFHSRSKGSEPFERDRAVKPGKWSWACYGFAGVIGLVSFGLPVYTVGDWLSRSLVHQISWAELGVTLWNSVSVSAPAAGLSGLIALPIAYLGVRLDSTWSRSLERIAYLGYATPRLAFALAWIVFVLAIVPWLYQTLFILVLAYVLHFLAEAIGPVRSSLYQIPPILEDAAQTLGRGPFERFFRVMFPLLRPGILVSVAFVFLSAMKELPLTLLLAPPGFQTLATTTWGYAEEAMFGQAAPFALATMIFSACFVGLLLERE